MVERKRIAVPFYEDEFKQLSEQTDIPIKEISTRTIREYFDLKPVARRTGKNTEIRKALGEKLKTMTDEQKEKMLKDLK